MTKHLPHALRLCSPICTSLPECLGQSIPPGTDSNYKPHSIMWNRRMIAEMCCFLKKASGLCGKVDTWQLPLNGMKYTLSSLSKLQNAHTQRQAHMHRYMHTGTHNAHTHTPTSMYIQCTHVQTCICTCTIGKYNAYAYTHMYPRHCSGRGKLHP